MLIIAIDQVAGEILNVNDSNEIGPNFKFRRTDHPTIWFTRFYDVLGQLLRKRPSTSSSSQTDTPPIQTIIPPKVRHSSPSTESTTSRDSTAEHFTHVTANDFVFATFKAIEDQLEKHAWYPENCRLEHTPFPSPLGCR